MKFNTSELDDNFIIRKQDDLTLVFPKHNGVGWTENTLKYRSVIFDPLGCPASLGFRKFFNWGERVDLFPVPITLHNGVAVEKIDGSLLICSNYKDKLIIRTRGTFDAHTMENGQEIDNLVNSYPLAFDNPLINFGNFSFLYEWVTPTNKIVIDYGDKPDIYLVGIISHSDYVYFSQHKLDEIAAQIGVKRPRTFKFSTINQMLEAVKELQGQEGICYYYDFGQKILKVKSAWYLSLHALKNNLNYETLLRLYFEKYEWLDQIALENFIQTNYDYEFLQFVLPMINKIIETKKNLWDILSDLFFFVDYLQGTRKEKALAIIDKYGKNNYLTHLAFARLDNIPITDKYLLKIYLKLLEGK